MTRIGVFADSHGDTKNLRRLLIQMGPTEAICFLGDIASDAKWLQEQTQTMPWHPQYFAVRGNNDLASTLPDEEVFSIGGKTIFLTHGHLFRVRYGTDMLVARAKKYGADIALYGHTHKAYCSFDGGVLVINPGAAGNPWGGHRARATKLLIDGEHMRVKDIFAS